MNLYKSHDVQQGQVQGPAPGLWQSQDGWRMDREYSEEKDVVGVGG